MSGPPPAEGATITTPVEGQIGDSQFGRILDPIRAAALDAAVAMIPTVHVELTADLIDISVSTERIIQHAKEFEQYLAGTDG